MFDLPPCVERVADLYGIPSTLIQAIHHVEGGWPGAVIGPNRNGTYDLGPMQINTIWLDELQTFGITREKVVHDACTNIAVGAWILRQEVDRHGNWPDAIAAYNAGSRLHNGRKYAGKVLTHWRRLWAQATGGVRTVSRRTRDPEPIVIKGSSITKE